MEKKLYDAAAEGSVTSLLNLLRDDALLLDRFLTGRYPETPLHVASMLGHEGFVEELLSRKPELAKELDCQRSSPLHLATAKGYPNIVKRLLQVNADMCLVCDRDGRNPLHIAAIKGHINVLRDLVRARSWARRILMDEGETILHACVRYNQLEALKLLVETIGDHDFVSCKNYDGNTILHLAIADKQIEAANFLISSTTIDVNSENADGFTPLDLLSKNERNVKDKEIVESLQRIGAVHAKAKPLSSSELKAIRTKILSSSAYTSNQAIGVSKPKKIKCHNKKFVRKNSDWVERKRNTLMLVASLLATMAFQAGVNPPSGVWQDTSTPSNSTSTLMTTDYSSNHTAGHSIMADNSPDQYNYFLISNTASFLASLSIILLLISGLPLRRAFFMWILMVIMWIAITAMGITYLLSVAAFTPDHESHTLLNIIKIAIYVWAGLMLLLLIAHTIRLLYRMIRIVIKLVIKLIRGTFACCCKG